MNPEKIEENITFPEIASELQKRADVDQTMREQGIKDFKYWDHDIDVKNTERMKEIVNEIGFPTISKVGKEGSHNAWMLVQHADHDIAFQLECLRLMKEAPVEEIDKEDIAYLEDRTRVNQGTKQLYGTQFFQENNNHIPQPIEDEEHVDTRRAEMGMTPLAYQIEQMYEACPFEEKK